MKLIIPALAASLLVFASCDNDKKVETETTTTTSEATAPVTEVARTEGKSIVVNTTDVPDSVRMSFEKKYPKVERIEWVRYEPIEADDLNMDDTYYYVRYNTNGADYTSWYNNRGEWVKTSTRITGGNANLPDAVNKTINAQYAGYEIVEIDKENDKDMDMYEIEMKKGEEKVKVKILPDGTVFKRKESK